MRKLTFWFPTRSDANRAIQLQKMASRGLKFRILKKEGPDCSINVTKTKARISFAVTTKLICVFVFADAKSRFSHNEGHIILLIRGDIVKVDKVRHLVYK